LSPPADDSLTPQMTAGLVDALLAKAAQTSLDTVSTNFNAVATSLNSQISTVNSLLGTRASTTALTDGLALKQDLLGTSLTLGALGISGDSLAGVLTHVEGIAITAGGATVAVFEPSGTTIRELRVQDDLTVSGEFDVTGGIAKLGSSANYLRVNSGHHIDALIRSNDQGRSLYMQYYADKDVRIGNTAARLGVCCNPTHPLDVVGIGRFSGGVQALSFTSSSDARIKREVLPASLEECTRLVQAVRPQTYHRTDLDSNERRLGYVANHWAAALPSGMRNIMGASTAEDGTELLALDYSRICCILHGSLIDALARISALESRLP
jgi:hypothetical protein